MGEVADGDPEATANEELPVFGIFVPEAEGGWAKLLWLLVDIVAEGATVE